MLHDTSLIATIVIGIVLAFALGAIAHRLKLPPLVGYLIGGVLVGPYTPGFVADQTLAPQLAEIGVILLMFGVGLHFSLKDLLSVRAIALPGAVAQMGAATLMGLGLGLTMGWSIGGGLVFGLALSVASTVVLLKALQERRIVETERGRIAVGWLIVEDLAMVLALVLIPAVAGIAGTGGGDHGFDPLSIWVARTLGIEMGVEIIIGLTLLKVCAFVGVMLVFGRRIIPWMLHHIAHTGSRELFRLAVLAIALGVAFGAAVLFGVSLALGAFFAGMILSESELSHRAAQETLPLRDAFAVLFFVSVGMLFDPTIVLRDPLPVLATVFIIVIGKSVVALLIVLAFRRGVGTALTIAASLAQIGEFSFILAELGVTLNLLPKEGRDLILAGAILSIVLNPFVFIFADRTKGWFEARLGDRQPAKQAKPVKEANADPVAAPATVAPAAAVEEPAAVPQPPVAEVLDDVQPTKLERHAVLIGFGRVGSLVAADLLAAGRPFVVVDDTDSRTAAARAAGHETIQGNAADGGVLALANIAKADSLIVAIPDAFEAGNVVQRSRTTNPAIFIIARAHSDTEVDHLTGLGADEVVMGEREIARSMTATLAERVDPAPPEATTDPAESAADPVLDEEAEPAPAVAQEAGESGAVAEGPTAVATVEGQAGVAAPSEPAPPAGAEEPGAASRDDPRPA